MHKTSFGSAWLRDAALFVLIGIYWAGILVSDFTVWPGRSPTILLALPLIAVALTKPPDVAV